MCAAAVGATCGAVSRTYFPAFAYARASAAGLRARAAAWRRPSSGAPRGRRWAQMPFYFFGQRCVVGYYTYTPARGGVTGAGCDRSSVGGVCWRYQLSDVTVHQLVMRHVLTRSPNIWLDEKHRKHYYP
eukprot:855029-Pleurochrysis_carterae.AAC.1